MKTAILTGASSGLGKEIAMSIPAYFREVEEIWLIARRNERLEAAKSSIEKLYGGVRAIPLCMDLAASDFPCNMKRVLEEKNPEVVLLVNCAGVGYLGSFDTSKGDEQQSMIDVNVSALTRMTHMCLPYMCDGGRIINIASISAFAPNPRLSVYSATKHYVKAFSRALNYELRDRNITVTAVCPGPMATEFVDVGRISGRSHNFESLPYTDPAKAANVALRASLRRKVVITPGIFFKVMRVLLKPMPSALAVRFTKV